MGKRIRAQKRGRGGMQFRAPSKGKLAPARYPLLPSEETYTGRVMDILHERGRGAPLARILLQNGRVYYLPATSGLAAGSVIEIGADASVKPGNVLPLSSIPEGTTICNIEGSSRDGGKMVKSSGASAILFARSPSGAVVRLPSGKSTVLDGECRATIGEVAGGGRLEKPFLKAGLKYHLMKAKGRDYPRVRGVAMASVHHPFGGGRHQHPGKPTSTSRHAPPGRKVGLIAPRKTGTKRVRKTREV